MPKSGSNIFYHPLVSKRDLSKLSTSVRLHVQKTIETKLATRPEIYGLPLRGTLKKFWKLRIGDYRIVYEIDRSNVYILAIAHRKDIYRITTKRS